MKYKMHMKKHPFREKGSEGMNYLEEAAKLGATDLHLTEDADAVIRLLGKMQVLGPCTKEIFQQLEYTLVANTSIVMNEKEKVKDFSASLPNIGRIRVRCYYAGGRRCMAIRFLPTVVPLPEQLGWPSALYKLASLTQGLVLVTGPTGSGKTTTLAALLERINMNRSCHIVTLEAPIEYVFLSKEALIHQCEIPDDIESFAEGATTVLRLDPDVIMVGELAGCEPMRAVLKLAESGHLVLATMHTASIVDAVEYFVNHFDVGEQQVIRYQLANVLQAVVAQRLLVSNCDKNFVAAYEILLRNTAMVQQIKSNDFAQLYHTIEAGRLEGMSLLEENLAKMVKAGIVSLGEALHHANNPDNLRKYLTRSGA